MADSLSWWAAVGILVGALILVPTIMGLFGGNKFDVQGKVRVRLHLLNAV
jgi:3-dehydrosphinganine reductase